MFAGLFKQKNTKQDEMRALAKESYALALEQTRQPVFYEKLGVPDSFDGRFDLLLIHIYILLHRAYDRADYKEYSEALFFQTFKDMDQTLREMGIGDVGVPKHMKKMMKAFNGRMHAYAFAVAPERLESLDLEGFTKPESLEDAISRNLYATLKEKKPTDEQIIQMKDYILQNIVSDKDGFLGTEERK